MENLAIIIPTLNEADALPRLLAAFGDLSGMELLVVDGGSRDGTPEVARRLGVPVVQTAPGRARQMNAGAAATRAPWLWFLHADSALPARWADQLCAATADPQVVGGGFTVQIDAAGLGYRLLDAWGWLRTRWTRTFFGDQGIFVRRDLFEQLGGFAELPVCEDLEFSDRLKRAGRVAILPGPIRTSARRWQVQGWWRTVIAHSTAVLVGGPSPSALERHQHRRLTPLYMPVAQEAPGIHLIILTKAPIPGRVKTRLTPPLTAEQAAGLAAALLQDTVALVRDLPGTRLAVAVEPPASAPAVSALVPGVEVIPQGGGDLGARMEAVIAERLACGASAVLLIGSDHPTVPRAQLAQAITWLQDGQDQLVLGPSADGGYYAIGLTRPRARRGEWCRFRWRQPHPELFRGMPWSQADLLQRTLERAAAQKLLVRQLAPWYDVDTPEDLARLEQELREQPDAAPACARWFKEAVARV